MRDDPDFFINRFKMYRKKQYRKNVAVKMFKSRHGLKRLTFS